jgi:hypothetical protein
VVVDVLGCHYKATIIADMGGHCLVRVTDGAVEGTYMTLAANAVHEAAAAGTEA